MPELPEVEVLCSTLKKAEIEKQKITDIKIAYDKIISFSSIVDFKNILLNSIIKKISRRGKYIIFSLSNNYFMVVHLKMTGHFFLYDLSKKFEKHEHIQFELNEKQILSFFDTRKFGKIYLLKDLKPILNKLGPEPLDDNLTLDLFFSKIKKFNTPIKALLLNQEIISGLGNIYADETLWEAEINPKTPGSRLSEKDVQNLLNAIRKVLAQGIKNRGTSLGKNSFNFSDIYNNFGENQNYLKAYMQLNKPCQRCGSLISKIKIAQRSTYFCLKCQKY